MLVQLYLQWENWNPEREKDKVKVKLHTQGIAINDCKPLFKK